MFICYKQQDVCNNVRHPAPHIVATTFDASTRSLMHSHRVPIRNTHQTLLKHWHKHALRNAPRALLRSMVNWFTEFCNSQWLLHFAAPFINMWTKTSVAESFHTFINMCKRSCEMQHNISKYTRLLCTEAQQPTEHCLASVRQPIITLTAWSHEWSFRRFTYGNLVTTSPSSKW